MIDLARANGIAVVVGSVLPASDFPWRPGLFVDNYSAMTDSALGMRPALAVFPKGTQGAPPRK
jgi:hypothetical protein